MTLETRLRISFLVSLIAGTALLILVSFFSPKDANQWVFFAVFLNFFLALASSICFFGFRLRLRLNRSDSGENLWQTSFRQGLLFGLALTVTLGLSSAKIATSLNLFLLFAFVVSLEVAGRRRKYVIATD